MHLGMATLSPHALTSHPLRLRRVGPMHQCWGDMGGVTEHILYLPPYEVALRSNVSPTQQRKTLGQRRKGTQSLGKGTKLKGEQKRQVHP